jgi:hypothetical protein
LISADGLHCDYVSATFSMLAGNERVSAGWEVSHHAQREATGKRGLGGLLAVLLQVFRAG